MTGPGDIAARVKSRLEKRAALREREIPRLTQELARMGAVRVILFGSAARRQAFRLTSDIDILAVMPSDSPFAERVAGVYRDLRPKVAADILVYTPEEFDLLMRTSPFVSRAVAEGVVLYEKVTP